MWRAISSSTEGVASASRSSERAWARTAGSGSVDNNARSCSLRAATCSVSRLESHASRTPASGSTAARFSAASPSSTATCAAARRCQTTLDGAAHAPAVAAAAFASRAARAASAWEASHGPSPSTTASSSAADPTAVCAAAAASADHASWG